MQVYAEEVNKIALSSNDDKRIQTIDKVTTFPYGPNVFKVCENEMLLKNKLIEHDEDKDKDLPKDKDKDKTSTEDKYKTTTKIMDKTKDILDMINKRIDTISKSNNLLAKLKDEISKKIELVYEIMSELQDEIYTDDSWLRLVELNKIDAKIDEALNALNPEMTKIDKHKDIDGYVSKLTDIINNKIALLNRIYDAIDHAMSEIKNETNMIDEKIHKLSIMIYYFG